MEYNAETHLRRKITLISFCASLLVIWVHAFNLDVYGITSGFVYKMEWFWSAFTDYAVPSFFFISGFLFFRNFRPEDTWKKLKSRVFSILVPYLTWCNIYYFYMVAMMLIPFTSSLVPPESIVPINFSGWFAALWSHEYYTLWFLQSLMKFIVMAPILYFPLKNYKNLPTGWILMMLIIINGYTHWIPVPEGMEIYFAGAFVGINYADKALYQNRILSCAGLAFVLVQFFGQFRFSDVIVGAILFDIALWYALDLWKYEKPWPWWMNVTFFTYLAHDIPLEVFEKLVFLIFGISPLWAALDYIFVPILTEVFLIFAAFILKRWVPFIWKLMTGSRG